MSELFLVFLVIATESDNCFLFLGYSPNSSLQEVRQVYRASTEQPICFV